MLSTTFGVTSAHNLADTSAQVRRPFRIITTKDGLPQSFISGLVQDKVGFIWVGTRNGLARYDGINFKTFRHLHHDSASLASNIITGLSLDNHSRLLIQYESGDIDLIDLLTENISHLTAQSLFATNPRSFVVRGLLLDSDENLWGIEKGNGLYEYNWEKQKVTHYNRRQHDLPSDTVRGFVEDAQQVLWVVTQRGISRFHKGTGKISHTLTPFPQDFNDYPDSEADVIAVQKRDNGEVMWGDRKRLIFFDPGKSSFRTVPLPHYAYMGIRWIQKGPDGLEYLETGGSIYQYDDSRGLVHVGEIDLPAFRDAQSFLIDRSGLIWFGTNAAGIHQIDLSVPFFRSYSNIHAFHQDLLEKELNVSLSQIFSWPLSDEQFILSSYVFRSAYDKDNHLWMTLRDRVGYYDTKEKKCILLPPIEGIGSVTNKALGIRGITFAPDGRLWVVAHNGYIAYFDSTAQQWISFIEETEIRQMVSATALPLDIQVDKNKLWLTTERDGLLSIDLQQKTIHQLTQDSHPHSFSTDQLFGMVTDPIRSELLWIGSYEGLICLNKKTLTSEFFSLQEGLPDNTIYSIVPDQAGYLWLSTNKGLCQFHPITHKVRIFQTEDGLPGDEFNRFHHLRLPDGRLSFGGTEGWVLFNPAQFKDDDFQPTVAFTGLKINNAPADFLIKSPVNSLQELALPYDQNSVTLEFAGLQFSRPSKLSYRYRLQGYDNNWIYAGKLPIANYTKLPPGDYTLEVNATNTSGKWSRYIKTLPLVIEPPLWATSWAYLLYVLLLLGALYGFISFRLKRERLKHAMLLKEKEAQQLRATAEWKSRFFSNITHEFRTPLTLIMGPLEQLLEQPTLPKAAQLQKQFTIMHRNARQLLSLINQLLEISKLEAGSMKLFESRGNIEVFLHDLLQSFRLPAERKGIDLHFISEKLTTEYIFDADKLEKIVYNLLSNALKFTPKGGWVQVVFHLSVSAPGRQVIHLQVKDTGIGIPADQLPYIFDLFYQVDDSRTRAFDGTGIGLVLVKELTELMGGSVKVESQLNQGTTFTVELPVREANDERAETKKAIVTTAIIPDQDATATAAASEPDHTDQHTKHHSENVSLVLIVEDNEALRDFMARGVSETYRVMIASNGEEGWLLAQQELPDLIISDVMMPLMDGYTLCNHIKNTPLTAHIAVILLTARASADKRIKGLSVGANDYLTKPFNMGELGLRIANALTYQQQLRQFWQGQLQQLNGGESSVALNESVIEDPFLVQIYGILEQQLANSKFTVEQLATEMAVTSRTLHRKLSALAGMSATELLRCYRLKKAATYLQQGFTVSETALKVGFESLSYFSKCFKEQYSISPSQYVFSQTSK